jgi:hypothetical protein
MYPSVPVSRAKLSEQAAIQIVDMISSGRCVANFKIWPLNLRSVLVEGATSPAMHGSDRAVPGFCNTSGDLLPFRGGGNRSADQSVGRNTERKS